MKEHKHKHGHEHGHNLHSSGEAATQGSRRTREIAELGLLYVGVPAVTLYPLGFVGLGIQLWRDPFFPYTDLTTIWQAVSLVPETVVIATGLELIYLSLVATTLGAGIASLTSAFLGKRRRSNDGGDGQEGSSRGLESLFLLVLLPVALFMIWSSVPIDGWNEVGYLAGFVLFSAGGGALVGYIRTQGRDEWFFPGLVGAYIGAILAALCIAGLITPGLALVETDTEPSVASSDCSEATGRTFVKLEEGLMYWHLYNEEGLFAVPHEELHLVEYKHCPEYLHRN